jgi:hypothetical protein
MREITLSSTYRQTSHASKESLNADPQNQLLSRMPRRRLSIEAWRDAVLSASGDLEPTVYGASLDPMQLEAKRRTIYSEISRLELNRLLALFDFPDPNTHNPQRNETTTPLQKLFVLNSPFMVKQAELLRDRVAATAGNDAPVRVLMAYRQLFGRTPTDDEQRLAYEFLGDSPSPERWAEYTHALLASNEFLILD